MSASDVDVLSFQIEDRFPGFRRDEMICDLHLSTEFRHPEIALLAAALEDGTREARSELGAATPYELAFTPVPHLHNGAAVLLHHALVEALWIRCDLFAEPDAEVWASFPEFPRDWHERGWPDCGGITMEEIYWRSDRVRRGTLTRLSRLEDPEHLTLPEGDGTTSTARWVINHLIGHEAYHHGQAVLLVGMARAQKQVMH